MDQLNELFEANGAWESISAGIERLPPMAPKAFKHPRQRRLGLRIQASCWALLSRGESSHYAKAVEVSATGLVLDFVGQRSRLLFRSDQRFTLDLFLPLASVPVRAVVRPIRALGERQAFEFVEIAAIDRLTLAEHLDRQVAPSTRRTALESTRRRQS